MIRINKKHMYNEGMYNIYSRIDHLKVSSKIEYYVKKKTLKTKYFGLKLT
jgi:hypothetical protein